MTERLPILSIAGRTIARIERDKDHSIFLVAFDEYGKVIFKTTYLYDETGFGFDTQAIERHFDDEFQ